MSSSDAGTTRRWRKRGAFALAALGLLYLLWSVWDHDAVMQWLQNARPLPFFSLMALLPIVGVPITPFFIIAGATFGTKLGAIGSLAALGVNLVGCYLIARRLRPGLGALLRRLGHELPDLDAEKRGAVRFTLAVKLAPGVPAFLKNFGLALAGIGFTPYFLLSMLISGTYGILIIVLGDSLFDHERDNALIVGTLLAMIALGAWWWLRRRRLAQ